MNHLARTTSMRLTPLGTVTLQCAARPARRLVGKHLPPTLGFILAGLPPVSSYVRTTICNLSCSAFRVYNILCGHPLPPLVAGGIRLKFQSGTPPRPA